MLYWLSYSTASAGGVSASHLRESGVHSPRLLEPVIAAVRTFQLATFTIEHLEVSGPSSLHAYFGCLLGLR